MNDEVATASGRPGAIVAEEARPSQEVRSLWREGLGRLLSNKLAIVGMVIVGVVILSALFAPLLATQHPDSNGIFNAYPKENKLPPSWEHPMGTDDLGRDILSLILYGSRVSLLVGVVSVGLAIVIGSFLGAVAGFMGGRSDSWIMRLMDILLAFPGILLALVIVILVGPGLFNAMVAVGIVSIPIYARIARASVLGEVGKDYVLAARSMGASSARLLLGHIAPNALSALIVAASLGIATAILDAAALGFLGLGAQPPTPEWGLMLSRNKSHMFTSPWMVFFPGAAIMFLVLGFNLLGDGLRDALDPRLARRA